MASSSADLFGLLDENLVPHLSHSIRESGAGTGPGSLTTERVTPKDERKVDKLICALLKKQAHSSAAGVHGRRNGSQVHFLRQQFVNLTAFLVNLAPFLFRDRTVGSWRAPRRA